MSEIPSIEELIAEIEARDRALDAFVAEHLGRSFSARPRATTGLLQVIVSPSLARRGGWRLTRFDRRGPSGHTEFEDYAGAAREAVREYGVVLSTVVFSG